ncbi:MAG TPA: siderophore-iron reductase FhuF [Herpetosiphonaceae bacterium]
MSDEPFRQSDLETALRPYLTVLGPYADRVRVAPLSAGIDTIPAAAFLEAPTLLSALEAAVEQWRAPDICVAASLWNKHYNAAVVSGVLAAMTLGGIGLDGSIANTSIMLDHGLPKALLLHEARGCVYGPRLASSLVASQRGRRVAALPELYDAVIATTFERHIRPVIEQIHALTRLSRQILWGNVANLCADLYDRLALEPALASVAHADRSLLLERGECPGLIGANPMHGAVCYERSAGSAVMSRVRQRCCLRYRLPEGTSCQKVCPLRHNEERELSRAVS